MRIKLAVINFQRRQFLQFYLFCLRSLFYIDMYFCFSFCHYKLLFLFFTIFNRNLKVLARFHIVFVYCWKFKLQEKNIIAFFSWSLKWLHCRHFIEKQQKLLLCSAKCKPIIAGFVKCEKKFSGKNLKIILLNKEKYLKIM